jgi:hypothetical protein
LITDRRNRLTAEIIEASECYNSWVKAGLLEDEALGMTLARVANVQESESDVDLVE